MATTSASVALANDGYDPCEPGCQSWLCTAPQLTGDWCGNRTCLAEKGITLQCDYTQFYFGNTTGGVQEGFDYNGHGDYLANFDFGKLCGSSVSKFLNRGKWPI